MHRYAFFEERENLLVPFKALKRIACVAKRLQSRLAVGALAHNLSGQGQCLDRSFVLFGRPKEHPRDIPMEVLEFGDLEGFKEEGRHGSFALEGSRRIEEILQIKHRHGWGRLLLR